MIVQHYRITSPGLDNGVIGQFLGYDGDRILLKMENGAYRSFAKKDLEEILPFTIRARAWGTKVKGESYLAPKGILKVGDLFIFAQVTSKIFEVVEVDTKDRAAKREILPGGVSLVQLKMIPL